MESDYRDYVHTDSTSQTSKFDTAKPFTTFTSRKNLVSRPKGDSLLKAARREAKRSNPF
jgi:hypothetical protein